MTGLQEASDFGDASCVHVHVKLSRLHRLANLPSRFSYQSKAVYYWHLGLEFYCREAISRLMILKGEWTDFETRGKRPTLPEKASDREQRL